MTDIQTTYLTRELSKNKNTARTEPALPDPHWRSSVARFSLGEHVCTKRTPFTAPHDGRTVTAFLGKRFGFETEVKVCFVYSVSQLSGFFISVQFFHLFYPEKHKHLSASFSSLLFSKVFLLFSVSLSTRRAIFRRLLFHSAL